MKKNKAGGWVESAILCKVIRKGDLSGSGMWMDTCAFIYTDTTFLLFG